MSLLRRPTSLLAVVVALSIGRGAVAETVCTSVTKVFTVSVDLFAGELGELRWARVCASKRYGVVDDGNLALPAI
jgi:hypothetical protein